MSQSNIIVDLVINVSLSKFTESQLKAMLCEALNNLTPIQAKAMLAKINMTPADLT